MRHRSFPLGLLAVASLMVACADSESSSSSNDAGGIVMPADRSEHQAITKAAADMVLAEVVQQSTEQSVDPLTLTVWDAAYDVVDARLAKEFGLGLNHSLDDQDVDGLVDDTTPTMSIFFMQQQDDPKEQCEAQIDIEAATTTAACTAL